MVKIFVLITLQVGSILHKQPLGALYPLRFENHFADVLHAACSQSRQSEAERSVFRNRNLSDRNEKEMFRSKMVMELKDL